MSNFNSADIAAFKDVWVFCEQREGKLMPTDLELISKGRDLADELGVKLCGLLLGGEGIESAAKELGGYGADKVYYCNHELLAVYNTDAYAKVICDVIEDLKPEAFLIGATNIGRDLAPRCAARLHTGLCADCTHLDIDVANYIQFLRESSTLDVDSQKWDMEDRNLKMTRPAFGGHLMATIICPRFRPCMATVRPGVMKKNAFDQAKADVSDDDVNEIIENLRGRMAELTEVTEDRLPQDGDTVDVDYSGTDEEGNKIDDVQGENFGVALGQGQALPDFEALVKTAKVGEEKTGPVNFPADYPHKPLAGKTVIFTIKVNKIQTSQKPEVNEEFAQKVGQESLEKMKASIVEHVSATKAQAARSEAMKKLIDGLLEKVSFEIPDSMLNARVERVVQEQAMKLQRMGLDDLRKDQAQEEKREEAKKEALETLRPQVFLMALAQKENITVNDQEVEMAIYGMAMRAQQDYKKVSEAYHKSGLIYELRDRILADKALEMVYSKAKINEVPAVSLSEPKNAD